MVVARAPMGRAPLQSLSGRIRPLLPESLQGFHSQMHFSMLKVWYGNRALHFEVSWRPKTGRVELGLHFESDPLTNARLLGAMRERSALIKRRLGVAARIEEWDRGWTRIWEPLTSDGDDVVGVIAPRLARYMTTLEPLLVAALPAGVRWDDPS